MTLRRPRWTVKPGFGVVVDEAELPELVHEVVDPRSGRADHLRQVLLIDAGDDRFGLAVLAKVRQQQEHPRQPLLARVEQLIDEIRFVADDAGQQVRDEDFRERRLVVEQRAPSSASRP